MQLEKLKQIENAPVAGKSVILRLDLNVPMRDGKVTDSTRLVSCISTIRELIEKGATVIMISHMGRPKGKFNAEFSLKPVAEKMTELLGNQEVIFFDDCRGTDLSDKLKAQPAGSLILLENLRFYPEEEGNDLSFARELGGLGDIYVNDAFSSSHRAHASIDGITRFLPSYAGPQLVAEITALRRAIEAPRKPVAALVGGAKVSTKMPILTNLMSKVDFMIIGGGMANTFLFAQGFTVGNSLCEVDFKETAKEILKTSVKEHCEIILPVDVVVASAFEEGAAHFVCPVSKVPNDKMILDIGPDSVEYLRMIISRCHTLLWNGPLGAFEISPFGEGTFAVARAAAEQTENSNLVSVAGGGDTVAALNSAGVEDKFTYISTAGGAFLEWLEGRELPGVAALTKSEP